MKTDVFKKLTLGSLVFFTKAHLNMEHGWCEAMDNLIGKPLVVLHKGSSSLRVTGCTRKADFKKPLVSYTAEYPYLEIWQEVQIEPWKTKYYIYTYKRPLDIANLKFAVKENTFDDVVNNLALFSDENNKLHINETVFKFLYNKYPFIICYAVARGIIEREPC